MLHFFPKIAILLFPLFIKETIQLQGDCTVYFAVEGNSKAECWGESDHFECNYASCHNGNFQWTPMTGCQLQDSPDQSFSDQQCVEYHFDTISARYFCKVHRHKTYVCPLKNNISKMQCGNCVKTR
ncbi:uncharacterized protein MELLADRAFT_123778 [Melampsora larici-populina 98AG31]|uniref:Secreted protein n=1 Tax=Melampsora larici-populina (strain 98AG31 / pathotype 3-4-7) TaxID=747676 RepID=F4R8D2_MELLP|nr:uncharacterized protein MELLADRAFT_123778 [Melampsora larici-populina 98AG31]EGG11630.1 secreted protein [Melampsora larici-populina 98AG31]